MKKWFEKVKDWFWLKFIKWKLKKIAKKDLGTFEMMLEEGPLYEVKRLIEAKKLKERTRKEFGLNLSIEKLLNNKKTKNLSLVQMKMDNILMNYVDNKEEIHLENLGNMHGDDYFRGGFVKIYVDKTRKMIGLGSDEIMTKANKEIKNNYLL